MQLQLIIFFHVRIFRINKMPYEMFSLAVGLCKCAYNLESSPIQMFLCLISNWLFLNISPCIFIIENAKPFQEGWHIHKKKKKKNNLSHHIFSYFLLELSIWSHCHHKSLERFGHIKSLGLSGGGIAAAGIKTSLFSQFKIIIYISPWYDIDQSPSYHRCSCKKSR